MAAHQHLHCHQSHHLNSHSTTTTAAACCCYCCSCTPSQYPLPPDPLVQSISSYIFHHNHPQPQPQPQPQPHHLYSPSQNPPHNHQTQHYPPQPHQQKQQFGRHRNQLEEQQTNPIISSLLRRIDALETSLRRHHSSFSLRDVAARTIQTHFRAFLVRRSQTLRHLEDLAFIKSALNTLKSSVSGSNHFDSRALSHKVMDLLVKLDSIRGGDPMIRDGKRSISRELIRFMDFIDEVSVKRRELLSRAVKNVRIGGNGTKSRVLRGEPRMRAAECRGLGRGERELMEKLREQVEKIQGFSSVSAEDDGENVEVENPCMSITGRCGVSNNRIGGLLKRLDGVQAKAKKNVSFEENGNVYRVFRSRHGPASDGDCNSIDGSDSIDAEREHLENLHIEVEENGVSSKETEDEDEVHMEEEEEEDDDEGSPQMSDDEGNLRRNLRAEGNYEVRKHDQEDGSFVFSAPLPVKMEPRADLMNKKKTVKVVK